MSDGIDVNAVKEFYNGIDDIWPEKDLWFQYTKSKILEYLHCHPFPQNSYILNAGSAGNNYGLKYDFHHVDIAEKHLQDCKKSTIASIESLPFPDMTFDGAICVGSVINYCDALPAISELLRVIKPNRRLILEFENSYSYEYHSEDIYGKSAGIVAVNYREQRHKQWLYSLNHISKICRAYGGHIHTIRRFHILSSYQLNKGLTENDASKYAKYDRVLQKVPFIQQHAGNIILSCTKL